MGGQSSGRQETAPTVERSAMRSPTRVCTLATLGVLLLLPAGAARATVSGTVVAWGCGSFSNAGQCSVPSSLTGVTALSAGAFHSLALLGDGTVAAWGCAVDNVGQCTVPNG